ncbi:MAG: hypothetical protein V7647_105 [Acidobacteriota bacterium]|jgi:hypothetical protein
MARKFSGVGTQLVTSARERGGVLLRGLEDVPTEPLDSARDRAAAAVEHYCADLIDELVASASLSGPSIKQCYTELALSFAKSVRDLEPDAERRHAIAQAIQFKILQSERRLRSVLESLGVGQPEAVASDRPHPPEVSSDDGL